jgi:hypothetical protein
LCTWLLRDFPAAAKFNPLQLMGPVREGLGRLEHAELVYSTASGTHSVWRITRLGSSVLADGSVASVLAG